MTPLTQYRRGWWSINAQLFIGRVFLSTNHFPTLNRLVNLNQSRVASMAVS